MAVRIKQDRTRRSGHKHSLNAQDIPYVDDPLDTMQNNLHNVANMLRHGTLSTRCIAAAPGLVSDFDTVAESVEWLIKRIQEQPK